MASAQDGDRKVDLESTTFHHFLRTMDSYDHKHVVEANAENEEFLREANIPARFTDYLAAGHESHAKFYREPELYTWLLEHQLKVPQWVSKQ